MGTLIVIDGVEGSGKAIQADRLFDKYVKAGYKPGENLARVSFPQYGKPSAKMVEMYLNGDFGSDPNSVDPYTASMMYTIDRMISYKNDEWGKIYDKGGIIIADRYYTSNIIHQGAKIYSTIMDPDIAFHRFTFFVKWITDLELNKLHLPRPKFVIWLNSDAESNNELMDHRVLTDKDHVTDIHESHSQYLQWCQWCRYVLNEYKTLADKMMRERYQYAQYFISPMIEKFVNICDSEHHIRSIDDISNEIWDIINN